MKSVCAALEADVDHAAAASAVLGIIRIGLHFEFAYRVGGGNYRDVVRISVALYSSIGVGRSIEQVLGVPAIAAENVVVGQTAVPRPASIRIATHCIHGSD